jgi:hypothetical protein
VLTANKTNQQRYELSMRGPENAVRLATILACGQGSSAVSRRDIEWGVKLADLSFEAAIGGVEKFMQEYLEFPKFCAWPAPGFVDTGLS